MTLHTKEDEFLSMTGLSYLTSRVPGALTDRRERNGRCRCLCVGEFSILQFFYSCVHMLCPMNAMYVQ